MFALVGSFTAGVLAELIGARVAFEKMIDPRCAASWAAWCARAQNLVVAYLLIHIGLMGGAEMAQAGIARFAVSGTLCVILALAMFGVAWAGAFALRVTEDAKTRISLATHFGSVSIGTFATVQTYLTSQGIAFDPASAAWLTLMEVPSLFAGILLLGGGWESLRRMLLDRDLILLLGSLLAGCLLGPTVVHQFDFIIATPFELVLCYFLLNMGIRAGKQIAQIKTSGGKLIAFGVFTPAIGAGLGIVIGGLANLQMGDIIILGTLAASASYVAAPAVMGKQVPAQAIATSLAVSLGVTLPWNILIGIPIYTGVAQMTMNTGARGLFLLVAFLALASAATIWVFRCGNPAPAKRAIPFARSVPKVVGYVDNHPPNRFDVARVARRDLRLPRARDDPQSGGI